MIARHEVEAHRARCTCEVYPPATQDPSPEPLAPGWYVVRDGELLHEEHVRTPEERAAFDIGRRGLR
jgi:hypothetical protein